MFGAARAKGPNAYFRWSRACTGVLALLLPVLGSHAVSYPDTDAR